MCHSCLPKRRLRRNWGQPRIAAGGPGVERWWQSWPEISDKLTKKERAEYGIVQWGFWNTLKRTITIKENGHDGFVYSNQAEGLGDSYVIFDPKNVTPRFGPQ